MAEHRIYSMSVASVFPHYVNRYLDKLVDELARGKAMEKILRGP